VIIDMFDYKQKIATREFRENYDRIFKSKKKVRSRCDVCSASILTSEIRCWNCGNKIEVLT